MKRQYMKPAMKAIDLKQRQHLLSGSSSFRGEISGYDESSDGFSQDE